MATTPNLSPPQICSSFTDPNTGQLTTEGFRFLDGLYTRTGGATPDDPAELLGLSADGFSFVFNTPTSTTSTSPDITFTANLTNITGTTVWTAVAYNAANVSLGSVSLSGSGNTRTLSSTQFNANGATTTRYVKVTVTVGTFTDTITIVRLDGGSDALTIYLTNEAATVPANSFGTVTDWSNAFSIIKVYKGATDVTNTFSMSRVDTNLTTAITGNLTFSPQVTASAISTDSGYATITATNGVDTLNKIFTVAKATAGAIGGVITAQSNNGMVFSSNAAGTAAVPTSVTISRVLGNGVTDTLAAGTVWTVTNGTFTGSLSVVNTSTGAFASFGPSAMTTTTVTFRCTVTDTVTSLQYYADITISKNRDNIGGYLTTGSVNLPANTSGTVTNYTNATSTFVVTNSSGDVTISGGNPSFSYVSSTGFSTPPTNANINSSGVITITAGIDPAATSSTSTWRATYTSPLGGVTTVDRTFTIGKAIIGATGSGQRVGYALYTAGNPSPLTGSAITRTGDPNVNTLYLPLTNSWTPTASTAWTLSPQTPTGTQVLYMSIGLYDTTTNVTTWQPPFIAYAKYGQLSSITADMGTLTAGTITTSGYLWAQGGAGVSININNGGLVSRTTSIVGNTSNLQQVGVTGLTSTANMPGVLGYNSATTSGFGIQGQGFFGIQGISNTTTGTYGGATFLNGALSSGAVGTSMLVSTNGSNSTLHVGLKVETGGSTARAIVTQGGATWLQGNNSTISLRMKPAVEGGTLNYAVVHDVDTTKYTIGVTNLNSATSAATKFPLSIDLATGELQGTYTPSAGGQLRLKQGTGASGRGVIFRNDGSSFYILNTTSGNADGTWTTPYPFQFNMASALTTLYNLNISQSSSSGSAQWNLPNGGSTASGKPGSNSTGVFVPMYYNGALGDLLWWPRT